MILQQVPNSPKTPRLQLVRQQLAKPDTSRLKKTRKALDKAAPSLQKVNKVVTKDKFVEEIALGWRDKLTFGKYNGKTIKFIFNQDPMYLAYIQSVNKNIVYAADVVKKLAPFLVEDLDDPSDEFDIDDPLDGIDLYNG